MSDCCFALLASVVAVPVLACAGDLSPLQPAQAGRSAAPLRDLSPDRPDVTESPITVDAGYCQVEASFLEWSRDRSNDVVAVFPANFKYGLTPRSDIQFFIAPQTREQIVGEPEVGGFEDIVIRYKHNLWGNDGGKTAFAVMPFVTIPTDAGFSGVPPDAGVIFPFAMELSDRFTLGLMAELDWVEAEGVEFLHTASLGVDLSRGWGAFLEYVGLLAESAYALQASGGMTYLVNQDLMLDCGVRAGLTDESEDVTVFSGFTVRF